MTDEPVADANARDRTGAARTRPDYDYENVETVATVVPFTGREYYLVSDGEYYWSLSGDAEGLGFFDTEEAAIDAWYETLPYDLLPGSAVLSQDDWEMEVPDPSGYEWSDVLDAFYDPEQVEIVSNDDGFDIWRIDAGIFGGWHYFVRGGPDRGDLIGEFSSDAEAIEAHRQSIEAEERERQELEEAKLRHLASPISVEEIMGSDTDDAEALAYAARLLPCVVRRSADAGPAVPDGGVGALAMGWSTFVAGSMFRRSVWTEARVAFAAAVCAPLPGGRIQLAWLAAGEAEFFFSTREAGYRSVQREIAAAPSVDRWVRTRSELTDGLVDPSSPWFDPASTPFEVVEADDRRARIDRFDSLVAAKRIVLPLPLPQATRDSWWAASSVGMPAIVAALARLGSLEPVGELDPGQARLDGEAVRRRGLLAAEAIVLAATAVEDE